MKSLLALTALIASASARAGTMALVAHGESGGLSDHALEASLWHALQQTHGHDAVVFDTLDDDTARQMAEQHLTTLLDVRLEWLVDVVEVDEDVIAGGRAPVLHATEYVLQDGHLVARSTWTTWGAVAMYAVPQTHEFVTIPEVALQEVSQLAVKPVAVPRWGAVPDLIDIPVLLSADEEYRDFYGSAWSDIAQRRIVTANRVLAQAGIRLTVRDVEEWDSPDGSNQLDDLLDSLASAGLVDRSVIRIGFTQQTDLATQFTVGFEDIGRAYLPGRHVLVADQALAPGHDPAWDEVEEGVAIAHEVMHALGVPHRGLPHQLMSEVKAGTVHAMDDATRRLGRTAAMVRYRHWDPTAALIALDAAATALPPAARREYIADNLLLGPGVPSNESVGADSLSAVANVVLARHYLKMARENPALADEFRASALAHGRTALAKDPGYVEATTLVEEARRKGR